jgi:hypothetical protein
VSISIPTEVTAFAITENQCDMNVRFSNS